MNSPASRFWRRLRRNRSAQAGGLLVAAVLGVAVFAGALAPYGPDERDLSIATPPAPPSAAHWLGVDADQKDVLSRVLYGSRLSLLAGAASILLAAVLGVPAGAVAGYCGGTADSLLMRSIDVALAFPSVLIALLAAAALGPGWPTVVLAVGLINTPVFARQIRVTVLTVRGLDYVLASRALGASPWQILGRAVTPSLVGPLVVLATLGLGTAILEAAGLSFLGLGGQPTDPEWGAMLAQAKDYWRRNPWFALGPGAAISLTILGCNLLGDGLRDALDPRTGERG